MDLLGDKIPYMCNHCFSPETTVRSLKRCGGCQLAAYCSKDCQKDDRKVHKSLCKEFPVVNGINALHTTKPWEEHLANLRRRAAPLTNDSNDSFVSRLFQDPKVCNTCRESRPNLLTMCKCAFVCYCSKKCAKADEWHKLMCKHLRVVAKETYWERMRSSYPSTFLFALEEAYTIYQNGGAHRRTDELDNLRVHIVTNRTYCDAKAWNCLFHHDILPSLKQLELVFITQGIQFNSSFNHDGSLDQLDCDICQFPNQKAKEHTLTYSVHQKPYHMYFSSSEYTEPDVVIVYGITSINIDIHSEISYGNMVYGQDSLLVLTDSTKDQVIQGSKAVNAARPVEELVPPIYNLVRFFGSNKSEMEYDATAINEKCYLTCLRRK